MAKLTSKKNLINIQQAWAVITVLLVGVLVGGVVLAKGKPGGGGGSGNLVYLSPSGGSYHVGSIINVAVRENSGAAAVNAVQTSFSYSTSQLQFVAIDSSASPFTTDLTPATQTPGAISLTRALFTGSLTGDQLVAIVSFNVIGAGRANLSMIAPCQGGSLTATCAALSSSGSLITISTAGASYKL